MSGKLFSQDEIKITTSELGYIVLSQTAVEIDNDIWIHKDYIDIFINALTEYKNSEDNFANNREL